MIRILQMLALLCAAGCAAAASSAALAHEVRPAALQLVETAPGVFEVSWKQPVLSGRRLRIDPVFPSGCEEGERRPELLGGVLIQRWTLRCALREGAIRLEGLDRTLTDALLRLKRLDGAEITAVLRPGAARYDLDGPSGVGVGAYLRIGIEHILFGPDHVLFVAGLVLVASGWRLLGAVTAFTLAHSLTLALSALGGLSLPGPPVEIAIALSVALLGYEALLRRRGAGTLTLRLPALAAFGFGLLHGLGFAGALAEIGLPPQAEALALLLFNLGVELGQLMIVAALLLALWALGRLAAALRPPAEIALAYAIGTAGFFWAFERVADAFA